MLATTRTGAYIRLILTLAVSLVSSTQAIGQKVWQRTHGGDYADDLWHVEQTLPDRGYILAGSTDSYGAGAPDHTNIFLLKLNPAGGAVWSKGIGKAGHYEYGYGARQLHGNSGYIVWGSVQSDASLEDALLIRTDQAGEPVWSRTYGGQYADRCRGLTILRDGYMLAGFLSRSALGYADVWLLRLDASGDTLWSRTYGGSDADWAERIVPTMDGGYLIAGSTYSFGAGELDTYLVKVDANGDPIWSRTYGTPRMDFMRDIDRTRDGGFVVVGTMYPPGSWIPDIWVIRIDASGNLIWDRRYGGAGSEDGDSVRETRDGGFIIAGVTTSYGAPGPNAILIRTDSEGNTIWQQTYGGNATDTALAVKQTADGGFVAAGYSSSFGLVSQGYILKTDAVGNIHAAFAEPLTPEVRLSVDKPSPNPFRDSASIRGHEAETFRLFDATGRVVARSRGDRLGAGLPPGVYFLSPSESTGDRVRIVKLP